MFLYFSDLISLDLYFLIVLSRTVYNMCDNNPAGPETHKLYLQYKKTIEDYVSLKASETFESFTYMLVTFFRFLDMIDRCYR